MVTEAGSGAQRWRNLYGLSLMENTGARLDHHQPPNRNLGSIAEHDVSYFGIYMHAIDLFAHQRALKKAHGL